MRASRRWAAVVVLAVVAAVLAVVLVHRDPPAPPAAAPSAAPSSPAPSGLPAADDLLTPGDLRVLDVRGRWRVASTGPGTAGDGLRTVCQRTRFADPRGLGALVRTFRTDGTRVATAVQAVEVSRSPRAARRTFATILGWFASCQVPRLQLVSTHRVHGLGDQAVLLALRRSSPPGRPPATVSVAVARTGPVTTSTVSNTPAATSPGPAALTRSLADAVNRLCAGRGTTGCVRQASYRPAPPPPAGTGRGLLAVVDLPPVGAVSRPWVATRAVPLRADRPTATSGCDRAAPFRSGAVRARSVTYLVPHAGLPTRFGLGETTAVFATPGAAARFLSGVRRAVAGCEDRDPATQVGRERRHADASAWDLTTRVSPTARVTFRVGLVRSGRTVAQLTFVPTPGADVSPAVFDRLLVRAGERLGEP